MKTLKHTAIIVASTAMIATGIAAPAQAVTDTAAPAPNIHQTAGTLDEDPILRSIVFAIFVLPMISSMFQPMCHLGDTRAC